MRTPRVPVLLLLAGAAVLGQVSPDPVAPLLERAVFAFRATGDPAAGLVHLDRALAQDPEHPGATVLKAAYLRYLGRIDGAEALLRQELKRRPDHGDAWRLLGELWLRDRDDPRRALVALERALAIDPDDEVAKELWGQALAGP